eukprot:TRINITY_DN44923_c0_g1_i1.p1 TRINITY_DN44923_c0_g1~~TRINITY_DN44923_c0_g1_i1.p1  ORF type:complete len:185 (-),score=44.91 TRINITY_DN44923_c0_g1_i1:139-693(-)
MNWMKNVAEQASAAAQVGLDKVKERADTAAAGKKLIDNEASKSIMVAKKTAHKATSRRGEILASLNVAATFYDDAAAGLRKAKQAPCPDGVTGYDDFEKHAKLYEEQAQAMRQALALLQRDNEAFNDALRTSAAEKDAMTLVAVKGEADRVKDELSHGMEGIRRMTVSSSATGGYGGQGSAPSA